jgi:hypothetical protein
MATLSTWVSSFFPAGAYYAGKEEGDRETAVLECGEDRRFGIFFSSEAPPARKQNGKAAILSDSRGSLLPA